MSAASNDYRDQTAPEQALRAPFPWFGGKQRASHLIWPRLGADVRNYVEPFFGSGAVLLGRPLAGPECPYVETVNDLDGFVANFWRAVKADPDAVAHHADNPVNENDLHARHAWLVGQRATLTRRLEGDPEFFDAKIAGWWAWGISCWIGSGFCSGKGPWVVDEARELVRHDGAKKGVKRQLVHLGSAGQGVNRKLIRLDAGVGANRVNPPFTDPAEGRLVGWMRALATRLRLVRVCSGDWSRVLGPTPTTKIGTTAVLLDPPYADTAGRTADVYVEDSLSVAHAVREWAIEHGENPKMRIALCGYEGEHAMPDSWECVAWKSAGGYGAGKTESGSANQRKERIWFSPHCLRPAAPAAGDELRREGVFP